MLKIKLEFYNYCNISSLATVLTLMPIHTLLSVWPQILVNISAYILPCDATREETVCMSQPSPTLISCNILTGSIHCIEKGPLNLSPMLIHSPPPSGEKLLNRVEERRVRW